MLPALIIVFREGFEAFLAVAIIMAFLRKTGRDSLRPAVYAAIVLSLVASVLLAWKLHEIVNPLWEGILGIIAVVLVTTFVIHVWRVAPRMKTDMEASLEQKTQKAGFGAMAAVFFYTFLMITREGMEAALMLIQVDNRQFTLGALLGLGAAALFSWAWAHFGYRINLKRFFQVTGIFLLLFAGQILLFSIHELSEANVFAAQSEWIHAKTEIWGPEGYYGRWLTVALVVVCGVWLATVTLVDRIRRSDTPAYARLKRG